MYYLYYKFYNSKNNLMLKPPHIRLLNVHSCICHTWVMYFIDIYTAIVLFEQSKCVDSIFTSDKRSLTVYNI